MTTKWQKFKMQENNQIYSVETTNNTLIMNENILGGKRALCNIKQKGFGGSIILGRPSAGRDLIVTSEAEAYMLREILIFF